MDGKKLFMMAGLAICLPFCSFGQSEPEKNEYAEVEVSRDTILIKKGQRDLKVQIYEDRGSLGKRQMEEIYTGVFKDGMEVSDTVKVQDKKVYETLYLLPFVPAKREKGKFDASYPFFYLSFGHGATGAMKYDARYPQRNGKSVDWGFYCYHSEIQLDKAGHWGVSWAAGFAYTRYVFDGNSALEKVDGDMVWQPAPEGVDYQKSWMRYWSFRIPIGIGWQKVIKKNLLYFNVGPEVEIRYAMKSKVKYDDHEHTLCNNLNTNVIGANLMFQAGYGCLNFIGRFGLTPLMDKSRAPHIYHGSLGVGIGF